MVRGNLKLTIPNPHGSDELSVGLVRRIVRQSGIEWEDWKNA
jgi:hypothetical protein